MQKFLFYFSLFLLYSMAGWLIETISCSFHQKKLVLNRGFLIGPYCPIYGWAAIIMIFFLAEYKKDLFVLFVMAIVYSSLIEYATSFFMEKLFKARWWDYSNRKFNVEGRICLSNCIAFGVLGVLLTRYVNPFLESLILKIPNSVFLVVSSILFIIFLADTVLSLIIVSKLKLSVSKIRSDSTEEIDKEVKQVLSKNRLLNKRIFNAFPRLHFTNDKTGKIIKSIKNRLEEIDLGLFEKKQEIIKLKEDIKNLKKKNHENKEIDKLKEKIKDLRRKKV